MNHTLSVTATERRLYLRAQRERRLAAREKRLTEKQAGRIKALEEMVKALKAALCKHPQI